MTAPTRFSIIQFAVNQLSDEVPEHWDDKGLPNIEVVSQISGLGDVQRRELNKFGRTRKMVPLVPQGRPVAPETLPLTAEQIENLQHSILGAENNLAALRANVVTLQTRVRKQRAVFADALKDFQNEFARVSPEQLVRDHIASEQEMRRRVATGEIEPTMPMRKGNSHIDRINGRGGSADVGYGAGYKRGAISLEQLGRMRAQAARARLPSER